MLSSVLRSKRAILVNIEIMRAFVHLRRMLASHADLARKLAALETKYDAQFKVVFEAIHELMAPPEGEGEATHRVHSAEREQVVNRTFSVHGNRGIHYGRGPRRSDPGGCRHSSRTPRRWLI